MVPKPLLALRAFRWEVAAKERRVELVNRSPGPLEIVAVHGVDRQRINLEVTPVEAAYRTIRAAAWDAYEQGRVSLVQRHIETNARGHQVFEYIAEGLL